MTALRNAATKFAQTVLDDLRIHSMEGLADIDLVCARRGVNVRREVLTSMEGMLIRPRRLIVVNSNLSENRQRFTIAHELGHWEMHRGLSQLQICTSKDIQAYLGSDEEIEANVFAGELLMPSKFMRSELKLASPSLATIKRVAALFRTSVTCAAIRICDFSSLPIVIAFSENGKLKWHRKSGKAEPYYFMRNGEDLDEESLARFCLSELDEQTTAERVESRAWFPYDRKYREFRVYEESVQLGIYDSTLSVITIDE